MFLYFILGVIEVLLSFRLILKLTGANPVSGFMTFSGRTIFQPFYDRGIQEIKDKLTISYNNYSYLGQQPVKNNPYTKPQSEGALQIISNVSFPIQLSIKPKYSLDVSFLQGICKVNGEYTYQIQKGQNDLMYECSFSENLVNKVNVKDIIYMFRIEEINNVVVAVEYPLTSAELTNLSR